MRDPTLEAHNKRFLPILSLFALHFRRATSFFCVLEEVAAPTHTTSVYFRRFLAEKREICRSSKITRPLMPGGGGCSLSFSFSLFYSRSLSLFSSVSLANETGCWISAAAAKLTLTARRDFPGRDFNATARRISCFRAARSYGIRKELRSSARLTCPTRFSWST